MDDVIAFFDVGEERLRRGGARLVLAARRGPAPAEDLGVGQQVQEDVVVFLTDEDESFGQAPLNEGDAAFGRCVGQCFQRRDTCSPDSGVNGRYDRGSGLGISGPDERLQRADERAAILAPQFGQPWVLAAEDVHELPLALGLFKVVQQRPTLTAIAGAGVKCLAQFNVVRLCCLLRAGWSALAQHQRLPPGQLGLNFFPCKEWALVAGGQCGLLGGDLQGMGEQFVGNRFQFVPVVGDDQRILRQIIQQGDRPRVDERQVVLQIGEGLALAQAAQIVAPGRQAVFGRKRFVGP